jgi:nicotinic acid mononucleotide adenylyltransferase
MDKAKTIIVLPDHNPYKELHENELTDLAAIKKLLSPFANAKLFTGFYDAHKKNPTFHWLYEIKQAFRESRLSLLMGFDTFMGLDKWIQAHELINLLDSIYVASRLDNPEQRSQQVAILKAINPDLIIDFLGTHPHEELSSTKLRENLSS